MASLRLNPPWVTYAKELSEMFRHDSEVHVVYDNDEVSVKVYVDTPVKAGALNAILPSEVMYGNVTLRVSIVPANGMAITNDGNIYENAFKDNGAFSFAKAIKGIFPNDLTYVVFRNKVVQYWNDDLGDIYGQCSTLYEDIARRIFKNQEGVFFCTDVEEPMIDDYDKPLGEWP